MASTGAPASSVRPAGRARRRRDGELKTFIVRYKFFHLLVLPGILYFAIFHYLPLYGLVIAFNDYSGLGGIMGMITSPWVGLAHFREFFESYYFWRLLRNTLIISGLRMLFGFPAPIVFAILLSEVEGRFFKRAVQTISYLPHFLSWVVVSGLVSMLFGAEGPINTLLGRLFGTEPVIFLADVRYFRAILVATGLWKSVGWSSILYFAAISTIPPEHYEVAYAEGASRLQQVWYVTLPWLRTLIVILLVLSAGQIINEDFEQIFNLYNPAVYSVSDVFETYIYRKGLGERDFSFATAVGLFKAVVSFVMVLAANRGAKALGHEGLW